MQEVLIAQKENAFLSQKLATIDTSLTFDNLAEIPFAPGVLRSEYLSLLKAYEFKSLLPSLPTEVIPEKKIDTISVDTIGAIGELCSRVESYDSTVILSTDIYGKIVV
jgi:5'-3' exonuclease